MTTATDSAATLDQLRDLIASITPSEPVAGSEPEPQHMSQLVRSEAWETAREIALRRLEVRPRSRAELAGDMKHRGVADEIATEVLDRFEHVGLIDDDQFARQWIAERSRNKSYGRSRLREELRLKQVSRDIVERALDELIDDETERAAEVARRKLAQLKGLDDHVVRRRLAGHLARRGYDSSTVWSIVDQVVNEGAETSGEVGW